MKRFGMQPKSSITLPKMTMAYGAKEKFATLPLVNNKLTAIHYPDWRKGNYYQSNLQQSLVENEVCIFFSKDVGALFPFTRNLLHQSADILHLHWIIAATGVAQPSFLKMLLHVFVFIIDLLVVKFMLRKKIVWTLHNLFAHDCNFPRIDAWSRRFLAKTADVMIVHSESAKVDAVSHLKVSSRKLMVIPHGNYLKNYPNIVSRLEARHQLQIPADSKVLLLFGGLRPYKGAEELISTFKKTQIAEVTLLIAGKPFSDEYAQTLRNLIAGDERIHLHTGFVKDEEVQLFMNAADICVFPFQKILTSGSLLLAMGFGRAIIAPNIGSVKDFLPIDGGILYSPDETNALGNAIQQALQLDVTKAGNCNKQSAAKLDWGRIGMNTKAAYLKTFDP